MDLSDTRLRQDRAFRSLWPGAGETLCEFRILGRDPWARSTAGGALQPPGRTQGHGAGRHEVALFGFLLHAGGILASLQQARVRRAATQVRPRQPFPRSVCQVRTEGIAWLRKPMIKSEVSVRPMK